MWKRLAVPEESDGELLHHRQSEFPARPCAQNGNVVGAIFQEAVDQGFPGHGLLTGIFRSATDDQIDPTAQISASFP
jgi:hypothetical protein